jgi:GWxTD domain-containing protein
MRLLMLLSEERWVRALGWSLLHFVWEGAIVAGLLAVGLKLLSGRSAQVRYGFACGALVLMTMLPLATFAYLVVTAHGSRNAITDLGGQRMTVMVVSSGIRGGADSWMMGVAALLDRALPWILAAWMMGVILFLGRLNVGLMVARRMKFLATHAVSAELERVFGQLKARLGISRPVRLVHSALVQVPTVIGWLRPVVLIPVRCLTGLSPVQIEAIFAHELAHIRRHDYLVSVLQSVVEAVLFYHPAVWWVSKQVRREREDCCDDLAVSVSGDSLAYAKALSRLEEYRSTYPTVSLGANGGALVMRIKRLLGYREAPAFSQLVGSTLLVTLVAGIALSVATLARAQSGADKKVAEQETSEETSVPPMYKKWLDEDVLWIITPEERAKYLKLENNDERNQFIKQFWERRNVDGPADGGNAYRAEYYRRIAYANVHFAAADPGWKSDRGRIYILYGNPDSIDSHPAGAGGVKPWEVWHYNVIQQYAPAVQEAQGDRSMTVKKEDVDMRFVDTCSCGNFRLQASPK